MGYQVGWRVRFFYESFGPKEGTGTIEAIGKDGCGRAVYYILGNGDIGGGWYNPDDILEIIGGNP